MSARITVVCRTCERQEETRTRERFEQLGWVRIVEHRQPDYEPEDDPEPGWVWDHTAICPTCIASGEIMYDLHPEFHGKTQRELFA